MASPEGPEWVVRGPIRDLRTVLTGSEPPNLESVREAKKATARRVLYFQLHVEGSHGPDATFSTRRAAEEEADRLHRSGVRTVVRPVHTPLPSDPWLSIGL